MSGFSFFADPPSAEDVLKHMVLTPAEGALVIETIDQVQVDLMALKRAVYAMNGVGMKDALTEISDGMSYLGGILNAKSAKAFKVYQAEQAKERGE